MVSKQGTAIGAAIDLASQSFSSGSDGSRVIVIISDGENYRRRRHCRSKGRRKGDQGLYDRHRVRAPRSDDREFHRDEKETWSYRNSTKRDARTDRLRPRRYIRATNRSSDRRNRQEDQRSQEKQLSSSVFEDFNEQYQYLIGIGPLLLLIEFVMLERKSRILSRLNIFRKHKSPGNIIFLDGRSVGKPAKFERIFAGFLPSSKIRFPGTVSDSISTYQTTRTKMYKLLLGDFSRAHMNLMENQVNLQNIRFYSEN